jgi:predicted MFS family arabinose efflux permease
MLGGFVFLGHQVGSFLGVWLGGLLYDRTGSYDVVWWIAIALGVMAAAVNLPIREHPIARAASAGA